MVDLAKADEYKNGLIPDADVETCLKVLRTMRNVCLFPNVFDAEGAVLLSHAHAKIHDLVKLAQEGEEEEGQGANGKQTDAPQKGVEYGGEDHECPDPDLIV